MGDVARTLGVGPTIEFEGQSYRVAPLTYELQAKFETWLERRAVQSIQKLRPVFTDDDYAKAMAGVSRDIAAGVYSFGGEACIQASKSIHGLKELMRLSLGKHHPDVDADFIDRLFEKKIAEVASALNEANADPKA